MKICLVTTLPDLVENKRIEEEVKALGHEFKLVDMHDFSFSVVGLKPNIDGLSGIDADIVIVRGIFNSIKAITTVIADMRKNGVKVFDNNLTDHKYSIDKVTDLLKLSLAGIPIPNTFYVREFPEYIENAAKLGYPVVVKSTRMGKGVGVFKFDSEEALKKFISEQEAKELDAKSFIMQEFVPYKYDLRVLIIGENVFCMRRIPGEGEFRANFSLGGSVELFDLDSAGKNLALSALRSVDMSVAGVDVLITEENRRFILEVNHTAGMVGMEEATGQNITKMYVEHAISSAK